MVTISCIIHIYIVAVRSTSCVSRARNAYQPTDRKCIPSRFSLFFSLDKTTFEEVFIGRIDVPQVIILWCSVGLGRCAWTGRGSDNSAATATAYDREKSRPIVGSFRTELKGIVTILEVSERIMVTS